jgi:hypothetical protein
MIAHCCLICIFLMRSEFQHLFAYLLVFFVFLGKLSIQIIYIFLNQISFFLLSCCESSITFWVLSPYKLSGLPICRLYFHFVDRVFCFEKSLSLRCHVHKSGELVLLNTTHSNTQIQFNVHHMEFFTEIEINSQTHMEP